MKEIIVFIDKGFLDVLSKYFGKGKPLKYDFIKLSKKISNEQGFICKKIFLYLAPPFQSNNPTESEKSRKENYDKFKMKLEELNIIRLREGRVQKIQENGKEVFRQKGVDNLLTKDLCYVQKDFP